MPPTNRPSSAAKTMISAGRTVRLKPMAKDNASAPSPDASATDPPPPVSIQPNPAAIPSTANRPRVCMTTSSTVSRSLPAYIRSSSSTPGVGAPKPAPLVNAGLLDRRMAMAVRVFLSVRNRRRPSAPECPVQRTTLFRCAEMSTTSPSSAPGGTRTLTGACLRRLPLPVGLRGRHRRRRWVPQCCWYHSVVGTTVLLLVPQCCWYHSATSATGSACGRGRRALRPPGRETVGRRGGRARAGARGPRHRRGTRVRRRRLRGPRAPARARPPRRPTVSRPGGRSARRPRPQALPVADVALWYQQRCGTNNTVVPTNTVVPNDDGGVAPVAQPAEAGVLNTLQWGFEYLREHCWGWLWTSR